MLGRLFKRKPESSDTLVIVRLNDRVVQKLESLGAPIGSRVIAEPEMPFGVTEGLAIYFNGTDLPDETYRDRDVNFVYFEFDRLVGYGQRAQQLAGPDRHR